MNSGFLARGMEVIANRFLPSFIGVNLFLYNN